MSRNRLHDFEPRTSRIDCGLGNHHEMLDPEAHGVLVRRARLDFTPPTCRMRFVGLLRSNERDASSRSTKRDQRQTECLNLLRCGRLGRKVQPRPGRHAFVTVTAATVCLLEDRIDGGDEALLWCLRSTIATGRPPVHCRGCHYAEDRYHQLGCHSVYAPRALVDPTSGSLGSNRVPQ